MIYLLSIIIFFSCGQFSPSCAESHQEKSNNESRTLEKLITGWYYITDHKNGIERDLNGSDETYFINPNPIVTVHNFSVLEIYKSNHGDYGLTIRLDEKGTEQWSIATGKSIGQKIALIINNELYYAPTINAQIDAGITALNRGDLTEEDLTMIKQEIEEEIK